MNENPIAASPSAPRAGLNPVINSVRRGNLEGPALVSLLSPYWAGGYREDDHSIDRIEVDGRNAKAFCRMQRYFSSPTDPAFHLTVFNATAFLCQVGIAHSLFLSGMERKQVEAWLTDYTLLLPAKIKTPNNVLVEINLLSHSVTPKEQRGPHHAFFRWDFTINSKWRGFYGIAFPTSDR
jgi:hypothetical protein